MAIVVLDLPILIIGFQRANSLEILINKCLKETNSKIYISMDGPSIGKPDLINDARTLVTNFKMAYTDRILLRLLPHNVGSAVNVITALDWFFANNVKGIVLEDDCIPHEDFFAYSLSAFEFMKNNDSVWFFSGFRPLLKEIEETQYALCKLPLNWGWGTTQEKWIEIRSLLSTKRFENLFLSFLFGPSRVYWNIGYRRIINGWVDAWDTAIAFLMVKENKFTLLPNCNLVSNIGNDKFALNTKYETIYLNSATTSWDQKKIVINYEYSREVNKCLQKNMIGIRASHAIIPIIKYVIQKLFRYHNNYGSLSLRLKNFKTRGISKND